MTIYGNGGGTSSKAPAKKGGRKSAKATKSRAGGRASTAQKNARATLTRRGASMKNSEFQRLKKIANYPKRKTGLGVAGKMGS